MGDNIRNSGFTTIIEPTISVAKQDYLERVKKTGGINLVSTTIFLILQTNSKAFTAKTSCVRRRYREFVWLKKQLQKNAGLACPRTSREIYFLHKQ
uniref:PX domain-containing protein n=1 Tax=Laticauda laticaudata TaxID=8630 RepID=A0A8C5WT17_LATLA